MFQPGYFFYITQNSWTYGQSIVKSSKRLPIRTTNVPSRCLRIFAKQALEGTNECPHVTAEFAPGTAAWCRVSPIPIPDTVVTEKNINTPVWIRTQVTPTAQRRIA